MMPLVLILVAAAFVTVAILVVNGRRQAELRAHADLYGLTTGLADITSGSANGTCGAVCTATVGYDFVTGQGSPRKGIDTALKAAP